jgi:hypothetical protein
MELDILQAKGTAAHQAVPFVMTRSTKLQKPYANERYPGYGHLLPFLHSVTASLLCL